MHDAHFFVEMEGDTKFICQVKEKEKRRKKNRSLVSIYIKNGPDLSIPNASNFLFHSKELIESRGRKRRRKIKRSKEKITNVMEYVK